MFLTATFIPKWDEMNPVLPPQSTWDCHPNIVARAFIFQFKAKMNDMLKRIVFGEVVACAWRYEWQCRGLPHIHLLLVLRDTIMVVRPTEDVVPDEVN
jgi:hypothetical protein